MDSKHIDPRYQTPKELAGADYSKLMESKHSAAEFLSAPDYKVRLAAILVCESTWKCGAEPKVVEACQEIAVSNAHDSFRICAIGSLSRVLNSSKSADISAFLANIILDSKNSDDVRVNAYWALREVQFGVSDTSFDNFLKGTFYTVKSILRDKPGEFAEDQVKSNLLAEGRVPDELWNSAEEIDWEFVRSFSKSN